MKLEVGKRYELQNGLVVTVRELLPNTGEAIAYSDHSPQGYRISGDLLGAYRPIREVVSPKIDFKINVMGFYTLDCGIDVLITHEDVGKDGFIEFRGHVVQAPPSIRFDENGVYLGQLGSIGLPNYRYNIVKEATKSPTPSNQVDHPDHYGGADNPYEAIKVIEAWKLGFNLGNTVKYISRAEKKGNRKEDLEKAMWYLKREIEKLEP